MRPRVVPLSLLALAGALVAALSACEDERRPPLEPTNPDAPFQPHAEEDDDAKDAGPPVTGTCVTDSDCTWRGYVCLREPDRKLGTCVRFDPMCPPGSGGPQPCQGQDPTR
jgi:hypothetical protein